MIEFRRRFEGIHPVAIGTIRGKGFLVVVGMAGKACGVQSHISEFLILNGLVRDILSFVAGRTIPAGMTACQHVTG